MSPDEVVERLSMLGVKMTRRTLLNYEKWGLVQKAEHGGGGAGGRWAKYHKSVVGEAWAAWSLIHGQYVKDNLKGLNDFFDSKPPKFAPKIIALAREWCITEVRINDTRKQYDEMEQTEEEYELLCQELDYGIVDLEKSANTPSGKAWGRIQDARADYGNVLLKIPEGGHSLMLWVKELWEIEKNKAILLEEQLIKTLE